MAGDVNGYRKSPVAAPESIVRFAEIKLESTAQADIDRLAEIAAAAPDPWSRDDFTRVLGGKHHRLFVAFENGEIVAFAAFCALPESETADLELTAVLTNKRQKGVAKALLSHAFAVLGAGGVKQVLLEMRASNTAAAALYAAFGAKTLARRPGMYGKPPEDGILQGIYLQGIKSQGEKADI